VEITALDIKEIHPPRHDYAEFQAVQLEKTAKRTAIDVAEQTANRTVAAAETQAKGLAREAQAYSSALKAQANAEYSVFEKVYNDYQQNPEMVRERVLLESLEEIYQSVGSLHYVAPGSKVVIGLENQTSE